MLIISIFDFKTNMSEIIIKCHYNLAFAKTFYLSGYIICNLISSQKYLITHNNNMRHNHVESSTITKKCYITFTFRAFSRSILTLISKL